MKVIVPVKRVPDTAGEKVIGEDGTVDRDAGEAVLCPVNEFAIEEAMKLKEAHDASVTVLVMGPESAQSTVRKALSYGLDAGVLVTDDAISGSDALATARVLAAAIAAEEPDVVLFGNQSTDARTSLVPAAVAELLDMPALTYARRLEIDGDSITVDREHAEGWDTVTSTLPAVVSVVEAINEPRYPNFKGIMAANKKPLETRTLADLGIDAGEVGMHSSTTHLVEHAPRPPKEAGTVVEDDGSGAAAAQLADWLVENKFV